MLHQRKLWLRNTKHSFKGQVHWRLMKIITNIWFFSFWKMGKYPFPPQFWKIIFPMIGKLEKGFGNFRVFQHEMGKWMKPNHSLHGKNLNQYYWLKILSHVYFYFSCRYYCSVLSKRALILMKNSHFDSTPR